MNAVFRQRIESLHVSFENLLKARAFTITSIPKDMPERGIYLFSEGDDHLYVGRSNSIRNRLGQHGRLSSKDKSAPFAFKLARESTGNIKASYKTDGSRSELLKTSEFRRAFETAISRVRTLDVRVVEEAEPLCQALLEIYVAVSLGTRYNDFDNH